MTAEYGRVLKTYREAAGLKPADLVRRGGIDSASVSRMESGLVGASPETAIQIANALNIPPHERAAFYLYSSGFPEEEIKNIIQNASQPPSLEVHSVSTSTKGRRLIIEIEIPS